MFFSKNIRLLFFYASIALLFFGTGMFLAGSYWGLKLLLFVCGAGVLVTAGLKIKKFVLDEQDRSVQFAASVVANSGAAFYMTDEQGKLTYFDGACINIEQKLSGKPAKDKLPVLLSHLYSEDALDSLFDKIRAGNGIYKYDVNLVAADGKPVRISHAVQHLYFEEGKIGGLAGSVRDFSEYEELRSVLARKRRYLETVMDSGSEAAFVHDLEGNFLRVNKKFSEFAGLEPELCVGTSIYNYLAPQIAEKFLERFQEIVAGGNQLSMQIPAINARGDKLQLDVRHYLILNDAGEPEAIAGFARKVKPLMQEAGLAKGEGGTVLMQALCHEMRTPLAGIIGSLHVLDRMVLTPDAQEYVRKCMVSAERFKDVVNISLNDLAGNIDPQKMEALDPAGCLENTIELFLPAASIQNRKILFSIDSGLPDAIICNGKVLKQALFCLINNGLEVFPDSDINVGVKEGEPIENYSRLFFYVTGTGGRFEPGKNIYSDCLVQNTVLIDAELYSDFGLNSELGFIIKVPAGKRIVTQEASSVQNLRIILAEDDISSQVFMRKKLESWGHLVRTASTGIEVLNYMEDEEFDLVLMDLQMPEMNGFDAIASIRGGSSSVRSLPIIVMSAYGRESDFEKMSELGVDDYIAKPVSTEELEKAFERLAALGRL